MRPSDRRAVTARRLLTGLWTAAIAIIAATTFFTASEPYGRWWFYLLWLLIALSLAGVIVAAKMWRRPASMILHLALLIILAGGALTAAFGERGTVTLMPGQPAVDSFIVDGNDPRLRRLPIALSLDSFVVERHRGISTPRDYISYLNAGRVAVNRPLEIGAYRIYQSSFTSAGGSVLGIDHDPARGREMSYLGYILLGIGFIAILLNPKGRFRNIIRGLASAVLLSVTVPAASAAVREISESEAAALDTLQVYYQGRVAPFSTPAAELLKTMGCRASDSQRIAASIMLYPSDWGKVALLRVGSKELRERLGVNGDMIAPDDLYLPDGTYRPALMYGGTEKGLDRDILELDAALDAFRQAADGSLCSPLPPDTPRLSPLRVGLERFYIAIPMLRIAFMVILALALAAFLLQASGHHCRRLITGLTIASILWLSAIITLKWIITGAIPMASGGDALTLISLFLLIGATWLYLIRLETTGAVELVMAGFAALVAHLSTPVSDLTPSMPVLASPWLAIHVSLIMGSYALLSLTFAVSVVNIFKASERLSRLSVAILYPATALLAAGIFTGAVWAGDAWGRYWAWDPKETWALVTLMVYIIPLHIDMCPRHLAIFLSTAFLTVLMTYFGVNFLPSLHAYQ